MTATCYIKLLSTTNTASILVPFTSRPCFKLLMSPLRRTSVRLIILVCALLGLSWTFGLSWELPESWKDSGILTSSRARIAAALSAKKQSNVDEIYGLLHLVTAESDEYQHVLTTNVELDPTKTLSLDDYAAGNKGLDWVAEVKRLDKEHPIVVFSKVCFRLEEHEFSRSISIIDTCNST